MAQLNLVELVKAIEARGARWTAAQTPTSQLTEDQQRRMLGAVAPVAVRAAVRAAAPAAPPAAFPPAIDWRNNNGNHVTAVRDQGGCGSCVSFGALAVMESVAHIQRGSTLDLSEADSHFCSNHGANCDGWWPSECLDEVVSRGVCDEACFPYASAFPGGDIWSGPPKCAPCPDRKKRAVTIGRQIVLRDPVSVKNHLASHGPVAGCLDVFEDFFSYRSGIYTHVSGPKRGGHCVQVIGYSEPEQCWIIKNSWNTTWGMQGFGKIAYTDLVFDGEFFPMYGVDTVTMPQT